MNEQVHREWEIPLVAVRAVSLLLACISHGPKAGKESDRCFTARATHFESYLLGAPITEETDD